MNRCARAAVDSIRAVVQPHGCAVELVQGGKHEAVVITAPDGRWCKIAHSSRPFDEIAQANWAAQDARRQLTTWGLLPAQAQSLVPHRRRRSRASAPAQARLSASTVTGGPARDPWAPLQSLLR